MVNKKPRIGGRCGVLVVIRVLSSETPAAPARTAPKEQQIYQQYERTIGLHNALSVLEECLSLA
jgi:hypothetical protein